MSTVKSWGSYLAVLLDRSKPVCADVQDPAHCRIADSEMARINIEASAALAQWIDLMRSNYWRYRALVLASRHLPMPQKRIRRDREYVHLFALSRPEVASLLDLPQAGDHYKQAAAHRRHVENLSPVAAESHCAGGADSDADNR